MKKEKKKHVKIDSIEVRLGKWNIPRNPVKEEFLLGKNVYFALGYFDTIEIERIEAKADVMDQHPLVRAYEHSYRLKNNSQSELFVQEIKAFTNVYEETEHKLGFTDEDLERFWKNDSLILCFSMIQLYSENNIDDITNKIMQVFSGKNYLYYFTFDYSGIIILAKEITIEDYTGLLFQINYSNNIKLVKDTFSLNGLQSDKLQSIFDEFSNNQWDKQSLIHYLHDENSYEIAVNISIQKYEAYNLFQNDLCDFERLHDYKSQTFKLSGRHDISVVNRNTDLIWILYVQYLLDKYTVNSVGDIYAYETFIKIPLSETYPDADYNYKQYDDLINKINCKYANFENMTNKCNYQSYNTPVKEVCTSIVSILKNGFARDFVFCIYEPFLEFLDYLVSKMEEQLINTKDESQYAEAFDRCFCSYFDGLNALVNSAMHTDRQFIRATSFSNIFYDVPPKIMAFYVAAIYKIREIMQTKKEKRYTFFISPSFSDEASVQIISYTEKVLPCDRILKVSINERSLYNPKAVIRRMSHEIAHFVGGSLRKRELRKEKIIYTFVDIILQQLFHSEFKFGNSFKILKQSIINSIINNAAISCDHANYSEDLKGLYKTIINYMKYADITVTDKIKDYVLKEIDDMLNNGKCHYFAALIKKENLKRGNVMDGLQCGTLVSMIQKEYLAQLVLEDIKCELCRLGGDLNYESVVFSMGNTILNEYVSLKKYARTLISLYSETYSDLQMILLLEISYEDYLKGFVDDENIDVSDLFRSNEDISRISVISQLMQENNNWETEINADCSAEVKALHREIKAFQNNIKKISSPYREQNQNLKDYLGKCMEDSMRYYSGKIEEITAFRKNILILSEFSDIKKVYSTICGAILDYRNTL